VSNWLIVTKAEAWIRSG